MSNTMPLIKKPSYIGIDSFLSNYNIVLDLLKYRLREYKGYTLHRLFDRLHKDLQGTPINSFDIEISLEFLQDKLEKEGSSTRYLYKLFEFLASEHFVDTNGKIVLNIEHIEEFQSLTNSIDMTPIYATAVDSYLSHYSERDKIIYSKESINNTILSYPPRFNFLSTVSDNHFHLGGSLHLTYRLNEIFKNPFLLPDNINIPLDNRLDTLRKKSNLKLIAFAAATFEKIIYTYLLKKDLYKDEVLHLHIDSMFRYLAQKILSENILHINDFQQQHYRQYQKVEKEKRTECEKTLRRHGLSGEALREKLREQVTQGYDFFHFVSFREKIVNPELFNQKNYRNSLLADIYTVHQNGELQKSDKLFWLLIVDYLKHGENKIIMDIIYVYSILRNVLRQSIMQQHFKEGLIYFSSVSRNQARRSKIRQEYLDSFRSIFLPTFNVNIEGRINFQDTSQQLATEIHNWLESFLIVEYENTSKEYKENQLSFILHFQKKEEKNISFYRDKRYISRHHDYRVKIFRQTEVFFKFLRSPDYKRYKISLLSSENLNRLKGKFYDIDCLEKKQDRSPTEELKLDVLKSLNFHKHLFINKKYCQNGFITAIEVDLTRYISGVDAASKEHTTPPEVFAPVFNYIRGSIEISRISFENKKNIESYQNPPKHFQFTFHVGEDFRDIITGMRRVVEAVIFLGMNKGDRIGHALALGLRHQQWARKKRRIFTTKEEQFDNAVFAYFILNHFSSPKEISEYFYQKALKLGNEIYQANFTMDNYINAWLLRRNCPINLKKFLDHFSNNEDREADLFTHLSADQLNEIMKLLQLNRKTTMIKDDYVLHGELCAKVSVKADEDAYQIKNFRHLTQSKLYFEKSLPDLFKFTETPKDELAKRYEWAQKDAIAWKIFLQYHYDKEVKERSKKKIDEPMRSTEYTEILQDLILEHLISKRDIIIETMPSSNVLNSYIEDYHNHPIFRFKPVDSLDEFNKYGIRKNPVRVIINTDNPGFQATSYINELFLVHNAGLKLGYSAENVEQYIKQIVELGNSIFENRASQE